MKKVQLVKEQLYEKFSKEGDPIKDMGIGLRGTIITKVELNEMQIYTEILEATIFFDSDGWDDHRSALHQIKAFAKGTHDLIDYDEINNVLKENGFCIDEEKKWRADGWDVTIPIKYI